MVQKHKLKVNITNHPEQKEGEVFVGNATSKTFDLIKWKTKRKGENPANIIDPSKTFFSKDLFPVFIQEKEMREFRENKFMKEDKK